MGKTEKVKWIDSLKGFACIIVIIAHIIASDPQIGMYANGCGKIGVWLFMLISGMLYANSSFHQSKKLSLGELIDFYYKRIIRIYPFYLFELLLLVLLGFLDLLGVKNNLLFQSAWGHLWYIPVILKFYLIAPGFTLLERIVGREQELERQIYCLCLIIIGVAFAIVFPYCQYPENSIQLCWYLPVFITGIILGSLKWKGNRQTIIADIGAIIGILVILVLTPLGRELLFGAPLSRYLQNKYLWIGFCWVLVILGILYGKRTRQIVEAIPGLSFVSKYSFELYLIHYIILTWLGGKKTIDTLLKGVIVIMASFIMAIPLRKGLDWINVRLGRRNLMCLIIIVLSIMIGLGFVV